MIPFNGEALAVRNLEMEPLAGRERAVVTDCVREKEKEGLQL